jgi:ribosomal protein L37E
MFLLTSDFIYKENVFMSFDPKESFFREITIPGDVLEDPGLSDGAKITYGKISRLSLKTGECWASNSFLDGTQTGRNASRFVAELIKTGYVTVKNGGSKFRKIMLCRVSSKINPANSGEAGQSNQDYLANSGEVEKFNPANSGDAGQSNQDYLANSGEVGQFNLANSGEVELSNQTYIANSGEVGQFNLANSGEVELSNQANLANSGDRTKQKQLAKKQNLNINIKKTAAAPDQSDHPQNSENMAAAFSPDDIKKAVIAANPAVILDRFYDKAPAFMTEYGLGLDYPAFINEQTEIRKPRSFNSFYYTLFFAANMAELYQTLKLKDARPPPMPDVSCPACGASFNTELASCPSCGLNAADMRDQHHVEWYKRFLALSKTQQSNYNDDIFCLIKSLGSIPISDYKAKIMEIQERYGLTASA